MDNGIRRYQLILGAMFAVAIAIYLSVVHLTGIESEVVNGYLPYADELMNGSIPKMEYPPFALAFIVLPRLFVSAPFAYEAAFAVMAFVFFMIGLLVVAKLAKRYYQNQHFAMLVYTALMLLMLPFVLDRYDIFPAILTLLSFYCLVTKKYTWAFVLLSIAAMTKLYPAMLFPIYLIPFIFNRDWSNVMKGAGMFVATAFLIVLPFFLLDSDAVFHFLSYHMDRPMQIESTAASFVALLSLLGLTNYDVVFSFGSDNMVGPLPDAVAPFLTPLMLTASVAVYALYAYWLSKSREGGLDSENNRMVLLGGAAVLTILAFIVFGKVLSSQYIIWIIPFVVFMMMTSIDHTSKKYILMLSIAAIALTQLNFAVNLGISGGGAGITDAGMMIVLARNLVLIVLFAYIVKTCTESIRKRPWRSKPADERYQKI
ncbi:MAG: DUF2029 domain-containing protein [Methanomassiliicoccaceae archaeon]|nr:DUF2029 domain-containing protein [Methanomassiliicoccaceae archaeon]